MKLTVEEAQPSITRLKRARGQIDAVIRMLEEEQVCADVVTQLSAAAKATDRAGLTLIMAGLRKCLEQPDGEIDSERLEKLFLSFT